LFEGELEGFVEIAAGAYPGFKILTAEDKQKRKERLLKQQDDPSVSIWGLFREDRLLGGMRLHDFSLQVFESRIKAGGVGMVAVDLLHKKEKVCREMIEFFLKQCREKGYAMAMLYPFRPDFYKKMGFGYGTRVYRYQTKPSDLPENGEKTHIALLEPADKAGLAACYHDCLSRRHGIVERTQNELEAYFSSPELRIYGYKKAGRVMGYAAISFEPVKSGNFLLNDLIVRELVYSDREVLGELLAFLRSQADQVQNIVFHTQDEHFNWLFADIRDGSQNMIPPLFQQTAVAGYGLMYRVINTAGIFRQLAKHNFGDQNCKLKFNLHDGFLPENNQPIIVNFEFGLATVSEEQEYDAEVELDISDFSSLLMGVIGFKKLHDYGLARISDRAYLETVDKLFRTCEKPICLTYF
jgi:predicted acetyltransferase